LSPLVQRARAAAPRRSDPGEQHWSFLLFQSFSAGAMAILLGFAVTLAALGLYVIIVWPLTFWDIANVGPEQFNYWMYTVLWSVFAGGSLAGFWCFSGNAFKAKPKARVPVRPGVRPNSARSLR
jgi:hypothetical protein